MNEFFSCDAAFLFFFPFDFFFFVVVGLVWFNLVRSR